MQPKYSVSWGRAKARTIAVSSPGEEWVPHNVELSGCLQFRSEATAQGTVCLVFLPPSPSWALWQKSL